MRDLFVLLVVLGGMIGVLFVAVRGFRPRSGWGGTAKARSWGFLRRYRPRTRTAAILSALPIGWGLAEVVAPTTLVRSSAAMLGVVVGFLCIPAGSRDAVAFVVGLAALVVTVQRLWVHIPADGSVSRFTLTAAAWAGVGLAFVVGIFVRPAWAYVPLVAMASVEVVLFGLDAQGGELDTVTSAGLLVGAPAVVVALVGVAPQLVLPLLGVALTFTQLAVDVSVGGPEAAVPFGVVAAFVAVLAAASFVVPSQFVEAPA